MKKIFTLLTLLFCINCYGFTLFGANTSGFPVDINNHLLPAALNGAQVVNVIDVTDSTYTTDESNNFLACNSAGAIAITLMASPATGQVYTIKDISGAASSNHITITPDSGTIDGASNYVINTNYGYVILIYNGTNWSII